MILRNKKIRVYFLIPSLRGGGAEKVAIQIASRLNPVFFQSALVVGEKKGDYLSFLPPKLRIVDLHKKRVRGILFPLIKLIKNEKPDILVSFMHHCNLVAILSKILSGQKVKLIAAERNPIEYLSKKNFLFKLKLTIERLLYRSCTAILVSSKGMKKNVVKFLKFPAEKIKVIYNPIDIKNILQKSHQSIDHPWLNNKKIPVIISCGRLVPQKGFNNLIKAFSKLLKTRKAKLIILGQGAQKKSLLNLIERLKIKSSVDLVGFKKNPYALMARADIFVLSSMWEGMPNVLLEAMALGLPIVSTDCPYGPNELIKSGESGLLVSPANPEEMAKAIDKFLTNRGFAIQCGRNARLSAEKFSIQNIVAQYEDFFYSLIKN